MAVNAASALAQITAADCETATECVGEDTPSTLPVRGLPLAFAALCPAAEGRRCVVLEFRRDCQMCAQAVVTARVEMDAATHRILLVAAEGMSEISH